jgi:uncharacterized CHY-type Zn-finger protein
MQSYLPDYTAFLCKFCNEKMIIYSETKGCYIDIETKQKHLCNKQDYSNLVRTQKEEFDQCTFCHTTKSTRAVAFYKANNVKATAKAVICEACCQKIFQALVQVKE